MKKAAYGLMAAFFASGVGGMPPSAADWQTYHTAVEETA